MGGSEWFSTLDLKSGYWQMELAEDDREKSAFSTGAGLWQFTVMPFGLCNAPATFERLMDQVLVGIELSIALMYLDDIMVHARSFEGHILILRVMFDRLRRAGLKLSPKKCFLFRKQVRRFVKGFADIARPLHQLTEKSQPFQWGEGETTAFSQLKQSLTEAPVLSYPQVGAPYILDTDASSHACSSAFTGAGGRRASPSARCCCGQRGRTVPPGEVCSTLQVSSLWG